MSDEKPSLLELVLVPAVITLAVTLLRLVGELQRWSPRLFSRDAGGPGALVGIVWLIPVFGALFGLRLSRAGLGPAHSGKALGRAALALLLNLALSAALILPFRLGPVGQLAVFTLGSWTAILVARGAWPALWRVLLAYALAARIPVVVIMFFSIFGGWDTHYSKPRPDFPSMGVVGVFFWTAVLPQLAIWIYLTVVGGIIFGALAVIALRTGRRPVVVGLGAAALLALPAQARDGKRIFISVDMEGIGGVVTDQQLGTPGFEYQKFRELMTEEANAAIAAAREAGARVRGRRLARQLPEPAGRQAAPRRPAGARHAAPADDAARHRRQLRRRPAALRLRQTGGGYQKPSAERRP